jgi:hypothetical protein
MTGRHTSESAVRRCFDTKGFVGIKPLSRVSRRQSHSISSSSTLVAARVMTFLHLIYIRNSEKNEYKFGYNNTDRYFCTKQVG